MKHPYLWHIGLLTSLILTGVTGSFSLAMADSGTHTFKRVKVGERPLGSRINIQISPEEDPYNRKPSTKRASVKVAPGVATKTSGQYDWFWADFAYDISKASLTRLNEAERQLLKAPQKSKNLAPSLADMRKLVTDYGADILMATIGKDVSPALVLAVIGVESAGKADAVSSAGAVGVMQLIPETAKRFKVADSTNPRQNIAGGVAYLDWLIKEFSNDPILALAGYNAGENSVKKYKGVPPYEETRGYVPKVVAAWQVAKALCQTPPTYAIDGCVFNFNPKTSQ
jgi:soluble lytic murein transglycosylase-like protein